LRQQFRACAVGGELDMLVSISVLGRRRSIHLLRAVRVTRRRACSGITRVWWVAASRTRPFSSKLFFCLPPSERRPAWLSPWRCRFRHTGTGLLEVQALSDVYMEACLANVHLVPVATGGITFGFTWLYKLSYLTTEEE
jgi:hypothetical protein